MGRYYSGDIEGKFWFGVQNSDDASFFGGTELDPSYINYQFEKSDLPNIEKGLEECTKELGIYEEKLNKFFEEKDSYNDEQIAKALAISEDKVHKLLQWYARKELGQKILDCVKKQDYCNFEAEL